mmetsp:Transcript_30187/g.66422  ORF Transcript_30187/g.66422 Transcript_30187/m.66422 type:complete len:142 (+) Transcript_30187:487-912(+)
MVLTAVRQNGSALMYATEALKADREVVLTAVQQFPGSLGFAADGLLEDPTFATEAKTRGYLLKVTMLSGRSAVMTAMGYETVISVHREFRSKLGLADDDSTVELWHCSGEMVPHDDEAEVRDWLGIQPLGEISEYQLLVGR